MSNSAWNTSVLHSQAMALWKAQSYLKVMNMKMTQAANSKCGVHLLYGIVPLHSQTWPLSDVCLCFAVLKTSQKLSIQTASAPLYAADSHWEAKTIPEKEHNTENALFLDIMHNVTKSLHHCCLNQRKILLRETFLCIDHCSEHEIPWAQLKFCFLYMRGIAWKMIKDWKPAL